MTKSELKEIIQECIDEIISESDSKVMEDTIDIHAVNEDSIIIEEVEYSNYLLNSIANENCDFCNMIESCEIVTEGFKETLHKIAEIIKTIIEKIRKFFTTVSKFIKIIINSGILKKHQIISKSKKILGDDNKPISFKFGDLKWGNIISVNEVTANEIMTVAYNSIRKEAFIDFTEYIDIGKLEELYNKIDKLINNNDDINKEEFDLIIDLDLYQAFTGKRIFNKDNKHSIDFIENFKDLIKKDFIARNNKTMYIRDSVNEVFIALKNNVDLIAKICDKGNKFENLLNDLHNRIDLDTKDNENKPDNSLLNRYNKLASICSKISSIIVGSTKMVTSVIGLQNSFVSSSNAFMKNYE